MFSYLRSWESICMEFSPSLFFIVNSVSIIQNVVDLHVQYVISEYTIHFQFESVSTERDIIHAKPAPPIEWHHTKDKDQFDLMTVQLYLFY